MSPLVTHRLGGQTLVLFAVTLVAILAGMALVFDVGNLLIQRRLAQDAADAGALAGSRALALGLTDSVVGDTITSYASGTGGPWASSVVVATTAYYVDATNTNVGAVGSGKPTPAPAGINVAVTRTIPATFSNVIGIRTLSATGVASGATGIGPVDVMLTLDTTGSMGSTGFNAEQNAVHDFVQAMKLDKTDTMDVSVKVGMARFQGAVCNAIDFVPSTSTCSGVPWDDATILSQLTNDPDSLMTIACGSAPSANCPNDYAFAPCATLKLPTPLGWDGDTSWSAPSGHITPYACPLTFINNHVTMPYEMVGTKLANAFNVVQGTLAGEASNTYWAWSDPTRPTARKVQVMMTDGDDNSPMTDAAITAAAQPIKALGVTVYTVGYYDGGISAITIGSPPYACPGPVFPPTGILVTATDQLMHDLSSSGANDCQYYAPLLKTDGNLPAAFLTIAGKIQSGRLTN